VATVVVFHRLAAKEARAAEAWYAQRSSEVAQRFRDSVSDAARRISLGETTHRVGTTRFWYVRVRRFPYRLIYCQSESAALVVAVSHHRRRPGYWRRRE
jgi:hypothetical protein